MTVYNYYDTDGSGFADFDIDGEHYLKLLEACFKYCSSYSWRVYSNDIVEPENIKKFQIPISDNVLLAYGHYYKHIGDPQLAQIRHYKITKETMGAFSSVTDSIFKWINGWGHKNPEDPVFYREDGSIFFSVIVHEGKCMLIPNNNEDISDILKFGNWVKCNYD